MTVEGSLRLCTRGDPSFVSETWGRKAAIYVDPPAPGASDLLSFDDVDRILSTMSIRTPMFRLIKAGRSLPEKTYTRQGKTGSRPVHGIADPARIFQLFDEGATIVLQGLHRYWEPVSRFVRELELELGHPCQVNGYVTPPGAAGLALHSDPHDVFVVQTFGCKHWEVHRAPKEPERGPITTRLEPGDAIYMPRGTPHRAATQETLSGHLTIGVNAITWRDLVTDAYKRLEADPSLDEALPPGWTGDSEALVDELGDRLDLSDEALGRLDVSELVDAKARTFLSTRLPSVRGTLVARLSLHDLDDGTVLRRRPGTICEVRRFDDMVLVLLGDRRLELPRWLEPALRKIASLDRFAVRDLAAELPDPSNRQVLARRLVREALLDVERCR